MKYNMHGIDNSWIQILIWKLGRRDHTYDRIILKCILQENPGCVIWARLLVRVLVEKGRGLQVPSDVGKTLQFE